MAHGSGAVVQDTKLPFRSWNGHIAGRMSDLGPAVTTRTSASGKRRDSSSTKERYSQRPPEFSLTAFLITSLWSRG